MKTLTKLALIVLLTVIASELKAQEAYGFSKSMDTYTYLANSTSVTSVSWNSSNGEYVPNTGFNFAFFDTTFSSIDIYGGLVQFGNGDYIIEVFRAPIDGNGWARPISYKITGSAGNQIFKLEWRNAYFSNGFSGDSLNAQLWLYEATGVVEVHIGPTNVQQDWAAYFGDGPGIGLESPNEEIGLFGSADNPCVEVNPPYSFGVEGTPSNGMVYKFTPGGSTTNYCSTSDVSETILSQHISVYPNLTADYVNIRNDNSEDLVLEVYNNNGQIAFTKNVRKNSIERLDFTNLPKGLFYVKIISNTEMITKRIIRV